MRITEVEAKSILSKSALADYALNCYRGCEHGCRYCYARFITRFVHQEDPWGSFVDVRINAPQLLQKEIRRAKPGRVFVSSMCDGWQPLEARYGLTRHCLEILAFGHYPVTILTKSSLALRDLDLVWGGGEVEVGATITTLDESLRAIIEPKASPSLERLRVLERAKEKGITTYAFLGPLLPLLSDTEDNIDSLLRLISEVKVDYFYIDRLNPRYKVWSSLSALLREHYPFLADEYRKILFREDYRQHYSVALVSTVHQLAGRYNLEDKMRVCF